MNRSTLDPAVLAEKYVQEVRNDVQELGASLRVIGLIASDDKPSMAYASATKEKFNDIGIDYRLLEVERLSLESEIRKANEDSSVHGIFIYFPVFNNEQDGYLRNLVDYRKDIEAGSLYWTRKLYENDRLAIPGHHDKKALLPCTPLAIIKILTELGLYGNDTARPLENKVVTIFNRSEVIGRPLAVMLSNDGAEVLSFDLMGPMVFRNGSPGEIDITREAALSRSDIVVTGVPDRSFQRIRPEEIRKGTVCINFSSIPNFDNDIMSRTPVYVSRVGPMTVAMCMRNLVRLYINFHHEY